MCGICGIVPRAPGRADRTELERRTAALHHRGPDASGVWIPEDGRIGLGHARLSILDIEGGAQPMHAADGRTSIVYNGEVYNFVELRRELEGLGHRFRTRSDTEVVLEAYRTWGTGCVDRFRGMFAFAIWDDAARLLFGARDRLGQKPLVYRDGPDGFRFASEIKGLMRDGERPALDPDALAAYLTYQYVPAPRTMFSGIAKLPPAHAFTWKKGNLRIWRYWSPSPDPDVPGDEREAAARLRARMEEAVRMRMVADVPVGAFLSGGIDSSIVVGLMARHAGRPVRTFSIGFEEADYDELRYARAVARMHGTDHHEETVRPDAMGILDDLVWHYNEPFADASAIPTMYLARMTASHVKVALSGDGGDELFVGYPRYAAMALAAGLDRVPAALRRPAAAALAAILPAPAREKSRFRQLVKFLRTVAAGDPARRYLDFVRIFPADRIRALAPGSGPTDEADRFLLDPLRETAGTDPERAAAADLVTYLPGDLLTKVDVASMAFGLEVRSPFLDHPLVATALAIPARMKMRRLRGKRILKRAFSDLLPPSVRRRGKMGFGVPIGTWFRTTLAGFLRERLLDGWAVGSGLLARPEVERLVADHQSARAEHSPRLWALLMLELWGRRFQTARRETV